jgi:hypothetical protein
MTCFPGAMITKAEYALETMPNSLMAEIRRADLSIGYENATEYAGFLVQAQEGNLGLTALWS